MLDGALLLSAVAKRPVALTSTPDPIVRPGDVTIVSVMALGFVASMRTSPKLPWTLPTYTVLPVAPSERPPGKPLNAGPPVLNVVWPRRVSGAPAPGPPRIASFAAGPAVTSNGVLSTEAINFAVIARILML